MGEVRGSRTKARAGCKPWVGSLGGCNWFQVAMALAGATLLVWALKTHLCRGKMNLNNRLIPTCHITHCGMSTRAVSLTSTSNCSTKIGSIYCTLHSGVDGRQNVMNCCRSVGVFGCGC